MDTAPSPYYRLAEEFALHTGRSIYLTGKAGTGKTTFLRRLRAVTRKQTAVVAPTGVAAINAGGVTMHSFFQLPFGPFVPTPEGRARLVGQLHMQAGRRKVLRELELLVIDEVSMVRADTLDMVDTILRHVRFRPDEPFGGVQVVFIGDLYQLSPVVSDEEWRILAPYYPTPYFFHSQAVRQRPPVHIELDRIFRQADGRFIRLLNEVRDNRLTPEGLDLLRSRYDPAFTPPEGDTYVTLTTHNYKADRINQVELAKLPGPAASFRAEVKGEYPEKSYPAEATLELKTGAKVMFLKNDTETPRRYFNGKIGVVEEMDDDGITIRCPGDDAPVLVQRDTWRNIRYATDPATRQIEEKELGTFTQYPLRLAWAITIHKSQGLTFDKAVIDAGDAFAPGQVYVALSRCRSLEGLVLHSRINPQSLHNDQAIVEHERQRPAISQLEAQLEQSKNAYRLELLNTLFELGGLEGHAARLQRLVAEHTTFSPGASAYADALTDEVRPLRDIGARFRTQLHAILARTPVDEAHLQARIAAASDFFCNKLCAAPRSPPTAATRPGNTRRKWKPSSPRRRRNATCSPGSRRASRWRITTGAGTTSACPPSRCTPTPGTTRPSPAPPAAIPACTRPWCAAAANCASRTTRPSTSWRRRAPCSKWPTTCRRRSRNCCASAASAPPRSRPTAPPSSK